MPTSQTAFDSNGNVAYEISDRDDDNGYFVELYRNIGRGHNIGVRYAVYSEIDSWDESTKVIQVYYSFRF